MSDYEEFRGPNGEDLHRMETGCLGGCISEVEHEGYVRLLAGRALLEPVPMPPLCTHCGSRCRQTPDPMVDAQPLTLEIIERGIARALQQQEEEPMGSGGVGWTSIEVGDLVGRKDGARNVPREGRVEEVPDSKRAVLVRFDSPGCSYRRECSPDELELLARGHGDAGPTGATTMIITAAGARAGHTSPYETCARCHPGKFLDRAEIGKPLDKPIVITCPTDPALAAELQRAINAPPIYSVKITGIAPDHSPAGPCDACAWAYCRVREVKAEPVARCGGCSAPTTQTAGDFQGGAVFAFPVQAPADADKNSLYRRWDEEEEKHLCRPCAQKVAEFINHLRDTHGGRR